MARCRTHPAVWLRCGCGRVCARQILALAKSRVLPMTGFGPGFNIDSHPEEGEMVVADGHEVAHHSWAHVPPAEQSREEEEADMIRANEAIERLTGRKARGKRSPSWALSDKTHDPLEKKGVEYDRDLKARDINHKTATHAATAQHVSAHPHGKSTRT